MEPCLVCGQFFEKRKQSIRGSCCSETCRTSFYHNQKSPFTCTACGETSQISKVNLRLKGGNTLCGHCTRIKAGRGGELNSRWRGGAKQWSAGRHGRDKDGLSWKTQRALAWARDNLTCQHCGKVPKRKPDVHHINPWMNSMSHALDNLICLCQSCHLKEEAKIQEVWGGQLVTSIKREPLPRCSLCHSPKGRVVSEGLCQGCYKTSVLKPKALALHKQGVSGSEIARQMGFTPQAINFWLRCNK